MAGFTSDWIPFGDNTYCRKFELYTMAWSSEVNLLDYKVAAAPFGGSIALIRDKKKASVEAKLTIFIFSAVGDLISSIEWTKGEISLIAWSNREDLLCIQDDGVVFVYDIYGSLQSTFTLDQEIRDTKVLECQTFQCIHGTGIAVLSGSHRFFVLNNIKEPKIRRLAEVPGLTSAPSSWCVITASKETKILVAKDSQLYLLNSNDHSCTQLFVTFENPYKSIINMSVSFDSSHITMLTDTGILWLGKTENDLGYKYCEFDTKTDPSKVKPRQLLWAGNQAVVGLWKNLLLVVGFEKDFVRYMFDGPVHLVSEYDGLRVIGNYNHELIQQVPSVVVDIFRIGSCSAGALLLEASKEFNKHSQKADEYIRMIRESNEMDLAVKQCIEAAGHEHSISTQKMLLRAASFGKCFVLQMDPKPFVEMCQTLRVLNAVRDYKIGLPLTFNQLKFLTMQVLLDRLILRRNFYLAIRIASYLKIPDQHGVARILGNWACYKVKQTYIDDEQVAKDIVNKLGYAPGISYSEIANKAIEIGRNNLAIKLLDNELRASEQVPLLLKLKQHKQALKRAIESGDTDLVYTVLNRLNDVLPSGEFLMTIRNYPVAYSLYQKYCKEENNVKLRDMLYQEDDFFAEGNYWIEQSLTSTNITQKQSCLQSALDSYRKSKHDFLAKEIEDQLRLIKYQIKLEEKFHRSYLDLSVQKTLQRLLIEKEYKLSEDFKKDFKIPDRRFWWLKMIVLAEANEWIELEKFSKLKKSPIGYEPFVDICLKHNNRFEAMKYVNKVKEESKISYYVKAGMLEEAAKIAYDAKDDYSLNYILNKCGPTTRMVAEKISVMRSQLTKK